MRAIVYPAPLTWADELLQINERFVEARRSYEGIVEQSYAQHTQPPPRTPNDMSAALTRAEQYGQQPGPHRYPSQPDPQQPPQSYAPQPAPPKCVINPSRPPDCAAPTAANTPSSSRTSRSSTLSRLRRSRSSRSTSTTHQARRRPRRVHPGLRRTASPIARTLRYARVMAKTGTDQRSRRPATCVAFLSIAR